MALLQKRPIILRSLLVEATPYAYKEKRHVHSVFDRYIYHTYEYILKMCRCAYIFTSVYKHVCGHEHHANAHAHTNTRTPTHVRLIYLFCLTHAHTHTHTHTHTHIHGAKTVSIVA